MSTWLHQHVQTDLRNSKKKRITYMACPSIYVSCTDELLHSTFAVIAITRHIVCSSQHCWSIPGLVSNRRYSGMLHAQIVIFLTRYGILVWKVVHWLYILLCIHVCHAYIYMWICLKCSHTINTFTLDMP